MPITLENKEILVQGLLFFLTFVGAFSLYLFSRNQGTRPFSIFYAINIQVDEKAKPATIPFDAIFTSLLGAGLAYAVTQPVTNAQAIAAGLGFVGLINSRGDSNEKR